MVILPYFFTSPMPTAEQSTNDDRYGYGEAFRQLESNQPSKAAKTPHSGEKQKKLTWKSSVSIASDIKQHGAPYIEVFRRSDGKAASLALNGKPPYVDIDVGIAIQLESSGNYLEAEDILEEGLNKRAKKHEEYVRKNDEKHRAITVATRGKISRAFHFLSGEKVTRRETLREKIPAAIVQLPTWEDGKKVNKKFLVGGVDDPVVLPVPAHADEKGGKGKYKWGKHLIQKLVFNAFSKESSAIVEAEDRAKEKRHTRAQNQKKKRGGKPGKTVAKQ